jgi:ATP-binding cassette, subfamily B, fatty acid transporter
VSELISGVDSGPLERPRARRIAIRLISRLAAERRLTLALMLLAAAGATASVIGPRILGHATDILFAGVIGERLPVGITKAQAIEAARARGDTTFADVLSRMDVRPGVGVDFGAIGYTLLLAAAVYVIAGSLIWAQARLVNAAAQRTMAELRSELEDKVHRLPLWYFDGSRRGELLSRVTNDIDNLQTAVSTTVNQLVSALPMMVALLAMMLTISPLLTLVTVLTVPPSLLLTRLIMRRSQPLFAAQWASSGRLNAHVEETYSGLTVVRVFGQRARAEQLFRELNTDVYNAGFWAQFLSGLVAPATIFIGNLGYVGVAVIGGLQMATGHITLGGVQAFTQYVRQFNQPLTQAAGITDTLQSGIASAERIFELLDAPEQAPDPPRQLPPVTDDLRPSRVEFDHVNFGYHPGVPVIEDLSLMAEAGSVVAIVGPTGAGKTTLASLLMRFYEVDSGSILIDGVDISTVSRQSLRSRVGMVLQDAWVFGGTIADNIGYGRSGASREDIIEAARAAHVDRFVQTLPDGYDTWLSDDATTVSVGEKQLITIARAFLAYPQLLILDEATSSVDTRTELLIQRAMAELRRGRTTFVIAHRLSTIRDADLILVVQDGRIVEQGNHAELLTRRGTYYAMTRASYGTVGD